MVHDEIRNLNDIGKLFTPLRSWGLETVIDISLTLMRRLLNILNLNLRLSNRYVRCKN